MHYSNLWKKPSEKLLFILVTHKPQQLLSTILSRCLSFTVPCLRASKAILWLKEHGIDEAEAKLAQSGFAPIEALNYESNGDASEVRQLSCRQLSKQISSTLWPWLSITACDSRSNYSFFLQLWCYDLASYKLTVKVQISP